MSVKVFRMKGIYGNKKKKAVFNREIRAINESEANEKLYSELGSKHRIKRHMIKINKVEIVDDVDLINNAIVKTLTKGELDSL